MARVFYSASLASLIIQSLSAFSTIAGIADDEGNSTSSEKLDFSPVETYAWAAEATAGAQAAADSEGDAAAGVRTFAPSTQPSIFEAIYQGKPQGLQKLQLLV